jgi:hypothetical protein
MGLANLYGLYGGVVIGETIKAKSGGVSISNLEPVVYILEVALTNGQGASEI